MNQTLQFKIERLISYLKRFDRVGVACSGGVDSTVLTHACIEALGIDQVVVLFADSPLLSNELRGSVETFLKNELGTGLKFMSIAVDPFSHPDFCGNSRNRCYICKTHIYQCFLEYLDSEGVDVLFDGTNRDDLGEDRPGLKALRELGIITPLVEAGFCKNDVREAAAHWGLGNARLPSNSCLATRLEPHTEINDTRLREIEKLESFLHRLGYQGCRVRTRMGKVIIEILRADLSRLLDEPERNRIVAYFQENGYSRVLLDLIGRKR
jgi:uncharacterized protein